MRLDHLLSRERSFFKKERDRGRKADRQCLKREADAAWFQGQKRTDELLLNNCLVFSDCASHYGSD